MFKDFRGWTIEKVLMDIQNGNLCVMLSFCASDLIPAILNNFVNPDTIFANNEMSLQDIEIYGFDYDYTLAFYSSHLHTLIFNVARDILIQQHRVSTQEYKSNKETV